MNIALTAAWEGDDGTLRLLFLGGAQGDYGYHFSGDGGATWSLTAVPVSEEPPPGCAPSVVLPLSGRDFGGPFAGGTAPPVRLGTAAVPFVLAVDGVTEPGFWGVRKDGSSIYLSPAWGGALIGSDAEGRTLLVRAWDFSRSCSNAGRPGSWKVARLNLSGHLLPLFELPAASPQDPVPPWMDGWITPSGSVFLNVDWGWDFPQGSALSSSRSVALWRDGVLREIATSTREPGADLFAVPTSDFSGAWVVKRDAAATVLASYESVRPSVRWSDPSRPPVEALHVAASGQRLLVQTSRHREPQDDDVTGLALWEVGAPAPSRYDALLLRKVPPAGFVHLDVDAAAQGAPVFFGSGVTWYTPFQYVTVFGLGQEAGVVRASLKQELVVPASGRMRGLFDSDWRTDLVLRNPESVPSKVTIRFLPNPLTSGPVSDAGLTLDPNSLTVVKDALGTLFRIDRGSGALVLTPDGNNAIEATSRTYTPSPAGTYGTSVDAVERITGAGAGSHLTFSAALLGSGFRTNLVASDAFENGSQLDASLSTGTTTLAVPVPVNGQTQLSGLSRWLGAPASQTDSLRLAPRSGAAVSGLIVIDDRTNDPCWYPPDVLGTSFWRGVIPAVVHADGAAGAKFRTDLFLFNPDVRETRIGLSVKPWDENEDEKTVDLTLAPGESRVLRDVLLATFGRTGVASLTFHAAPVSAFGVRASSRTYTEQPDGSTFGTQLPPLDPSQTAGAGETLEILGPTGGSGTRTNLSLVRVVDLNPWLTRSGLPLTAQVAILDDQGSQLDTFDVQVPPRGGVQINDLFRKRGLGGGPRAALIRVTPSDGLLAAYATTMDNGTNDPVYFAGRLALEP